MVSKSSLFFTSLHFSLSQFLPGPRKRLTVTLTRTFGQSPRFPCCQDLLELWVVKYSIPGRVLGCFSLFGVGLLLMIGADIFLAQCADATLCSILSILCALYFPFKFRSHRPDLTLIVLLLAVFWLVCGFWWWLGYLFLIYFTNTHVKEGDFVD